MKHSNIWLGLTLIASALLLNGARSAKADPPQIPSPQASSTAKSPSSGDNAQHQNGSATSSSVPSPDLSQSIAPNQNADDQNQKSEALNLNRRLTDYTGSLATYTFLLVVVGAVSILIAFLQAGLFYLSIQEYIRPKIRIRTLSMVNDLPTRMDDKAPFKFSVVLTNHGGSRAKIISGNFTVRTSLGKEVPSWGYGEPAYRPPYDFLKGQIISCGPDAVFPETAERSYPASEIQELIDGRLFLHVVGFIWYRGRFFSRGYKTAFCRRYDVKKERLVRSGGPEWDFAD